MSSLHPLLFKAWTERFPEKSRLCCQKESDAFWSNQKKVFGKNIKDFEKCINQKIAELKQGTTKRKTTMLQFFLKQVMPRYQKYLPTESTSTNAENPTTSCNLPNLSPELLSEIEENNSNSSLSSGSSILEKPTTSSNMTPAQDKAKQMINILESDLNNLLLKRDSGLGGDQINDEIKKLKKKLYESKKLHKGKKRNAEYQKTFRAKRQAIIKNIISEDPVMRKKLNIRDSLGRPRLEEDQPELLRVMAEIAKFGGGADDRRRTEIIRSCRTLKDLTEQLQSEGFSLSRSATYLRLLPRNSNTIEGKKHVKTVPVKLARATTDLHKSHPDAKSCTASIRSLESLASILGPDQVLFLSQDDKARVPIGKTAVVKQSPFLMHMEYRVRLPDHDWMVAEGHKLIPSVYAGIKIAEKGMGKPEAVTYSGPTYVAIRSGKHSSSTAKSHGDDLNRLLDLDEFKNIAKNSAGLVKPIMIITVDGGPDENPRFPRVIAQAVTHFKTYNLDALYIVTNAPGRSCFNRVERRMAPLSHHLSGVILPHDSFGNHLNESRITIDKDLEIQNFAKAGNTLAEVWNELIIDGEPVIAEYKDPEINENCDIEDKFTQDWYRVHVRESQYLLQITKCKEFECCGVHRSNLRAILQSGFLPPPCILQQSSTLTLPPPGDDNDSEYCPLFILLSLNINIPNPLAFKVIPYDYYCPSVKESLIGRICEICGLYFATKKNAEEHKKVLHGSQCARTEKIVPLKIFRQRAGQSLCLFRDTESTSEVNTQEWLDDEEINVELMVEDTETLSQSCDIPIVSSVSEWMVSPWTTDI